jgi:hypothetical protein
MRLITVVFTGVLMLAMAVPAMSFQGSDPLTGTWAGDWGPTAAHRNPVTVELKWDGTALTGSVNPGPNAIPLQKAAYDAASGTIRLEAEATSRRGGTVRYVVEGKVANGSLTGTWTHDSTRGDFRITKR